MGEASFKIKSTEHNVLVNKRIYTHIHTNTQTNNGTHREKREKNI